MPMANPRIAQSDGDTTIPMPRSVRRSERKSIQKSYLYAVPDPAQDRDAAERWFARKTRASAKHVQKMVALYLLLCEADPAADPSARKTRTSTSSIAKRSSSPRIPIGKKTELGTETLSVPNGVDVTATGRGQTTPPVSFNSTLPAPAIHLDIQIHIDPNASADQIDHIFSSMAKHLKYWYNPEAR